MLIAENLENMEEQKYVSALFTNTTFWLSYSAAHSSLQTTL